MWCQFWAWYLQQKNLPGPNFITEEAWESVYQSAHVYYSDQVREHAAESSQYAGYML